MRDQPCPCGFAAPYSACCGQFHSGLTTPPTAEQLMRSRYSAFAVGAADYLLRTWHPTTRPDSLELDSAQRWTGLQILATWRGGLVDAQGSVEFRASYRWRGRNETMQENSAFERIDGQWLYLRGR